jgi:hypothetical protein
MDRARLQSAALNYPYMRGLLAVPAGALFIVAALGNWEWGPPRHAWVFIAAVAVIGLVVAAVNRYYNEHYGRVTPSNAQQLKAGAATAAGIALMVGGSMLLRSRASWSLDLPVNAVAAMFAALMLVYYAAVVGLRRHHVVIWGALLVAGALPVWNGSDPSNIGLVLAGVAVMINGAFDHRVLARTLGPPPTPALGHEHVGQ